MPKRASARPGQVDGLNANDPGVGLLAAAVRRENPKGLLLVCSGALPGIDPSAPRLILDAREARRTGAEAIPFAQWPTRHGTADVAVMWPRAHLGKDFSQQCVAVSLMTLREGGRLLCAVKKQKGADSIADFMGETFGNVSVLDRTKGYRLFESVREGSPSRPAVLDVRYEIRDERLGEDVLQSAPGVFSRKELDRGTKCLIDHVAGLDTTPSKIVDIGAGVGPLTVWAARRWPKASVVAVESNFVSASLLRENVKAAGLSGRVFAMEHDGLPSTVAAVRQFIGTTDLTLTNPPTHADAGALDALLGPLASWQRKGSRTLAVVSRPEMVAGALRRAGASVQVVPYDRFSVLDARW